MNIFWIIAISFGVFVVQIANAQAADDQVTKVVAQAFAEAKKMPLGLDQLKLAESLANRHGRACLAAMTEILIKSEWPPDPFASMLAAKVSDPDGRHKMLERFRELRDPQGLMTVAGIALPGDEEAKKLLIRMATAEYAKYSGYSQFACGFLRSFDPVSVRPAIEESVRRDKELSRDKMSDAQHREELLEYLKYMEALPPKERLVCMDFNRRFWWTRAMSDMRTIRIYLEYEVAGDTFKKNFVPSDEQCLRHSLLVSPSDDEVATAIGIALACQLRGLEDALRNYAKQNRRFSVFALLTLQEMGLAESASTQPTSRPKK